jgi:hypothetical protein
MATNFPPPDDEGDDKLFGLPRNLVIIGGLGLGAIVVMNMLRGNGGNVPTANMVPMSTAVQLGDVQQRQQEIFGRLGELSFNTGKGLSDLSSQMDSGFDTTQGWLADIRGRQTQSDLLARDYYDSIVGWITTQSERNIRETDTVGGMIMDRMVTQNNLAHQYYQDLLGDINQHSANITQQQASNMAQLRAEQTQLAEMLERLNTSVRQVGWDNWYQGWRENFGVTDAGNAFDVNRDNLVDIRDYGLGRQRYAVS